MRACIATPAFVVGFMVSYLFANAALRADEVVTSTPTTLGDNADGLLVLKDGGVLAGKITHAADWYVVTRGNGEMQIAASRVMLVCRTMEEAYEFRRQQITGTKVEPHLSLADWCMRYSLLDEAARELADSRQLDPDHPRVALLERRLEKARAQPVAKSIVPPATKVMSANATPTEPATTTTVSTTDLPASVVERFTRKVQPILVNNCTMSGCHQQGGAQAFRLDRALLRGEANRRSTMHNLEAALTLVNRDEPNESPLLTIPRKTHGGMAGPIFGPRHEQAFKHLADWVELIAPPILPDEKANVDGRLNAAAQSGGRSTAQPQSAIRAVNQLEGIPTLETQSTPEDADAGVANNVSPPTLRSPHRLQYGARLQTWQPRDPFDPEIFNRSMRTQAPAASPTAVAPTQQRR